MNKMYLLLKITYANGEFISDTKTLMGSFNIETIAKYVKDIIEEGIKDNQETIDYYGIDLNELRKPISITNPIIIRESDDIKYEIIEVEVK